MARIRDIRNLHESIQQSEDVDITATKAQRKTEVAEQILRDLETKAPGDTISVGGISSVSSESGSPLSTVGLANTSSDSLPDAQQDSLAGAVKAADAEQSSPVATGAQRGSSAETAHFAGSAAKSFLRRGEGQNASGAPTIQNSPTLASNESQQRVNARAAEKAASGLRAAGDADVGGERAATELMANAGSAQQGAAAAGAQQDAPAAAGSQQGRLAETGHFAGGAKSFLRSGQGRNASGAPTIQNSPTLASQQSQQRVNTRSAEKAATGLRAAGDADVGGERAATELMANAGGAQQGAAAAGAQQDAPAAAGAQQGRLADTGHFAGSAARSLRRGGATTNADVTAETSRSNFLRQGEGRGAGTHTRYGGETIQGGGGDIHGRHDAQQRVNAHVAAQKASATGGVRAAGDADVGGDRATTDLMASTSRACVTMPEAGQAFARAAQRADAAQEQTHTAGAENTSSGPSISRPTR